MKVEGTLIGIGLLWLSIAAVAKGWLMPWGVVLWVPTFLLSLLFLSFVGHFLFLGPVFALLDLIKRVTGSAKTTQCEPEDGEGR